MRWSGVAAAVAVVAVASVTASAHARTSSSATAAHPRALKGEIVYPCLANYEPAGWFPELCAVGGEGSLHTITAEREAKNDPAWSSDGTLLAYDVNGQIYAHDVWEYEHQWADDSKLLGPGTQPTWSPDASSLAFTYGGDIYVMSATGANRHRLTTNPASEDEPSWSPDGKVVAFHRGGALWRTGVDGTGERSLGAGADPAWAPNGSKLAFSYQGDIWTMNPDGSGRQDVTNTPGVDESKPSWGADSNNLAFIGRPAGGGGYADLYQMEIGHAIHELNVGDSGDQPIAEDAVAWQPVRVLVETVSSRRPYVSLRDAQGHKLSTIRGGRLALAYVDHSKTGGWAWSLGPQGFVGGWTVKFTGTRWPKLFAAGVDDQNSTSGDWKLGTVTYWDPKHKRRRGSFTVVDAP